MYRSLHVEVIPKFCNQFKIHKKKLTKQEPTNKNKTEIMAMYRRNITSSVYSKLIIIYERNHPFCKCSSFPLRISCMITKYLCAHEGLIHQLRILNMNYNHENNNIKSLMYKTFYSRVTISQKSVAFIIKLALRLRNFK